MLDMTSSNAGDPSRPGRTPARSRRADREAAVRSLRWALVSHHGAVLGVLAQKPDVTVREVAATIGVTERSATNILRDLRDAGYVDARRVGRRNIYTVNTAQRLRRPEYSASTVRELLAALHALDADGRTSAAGPLSQADDAASDREPASR